MDLFEPRDFLPFYQLDSNALTLSIGTTNKALAVGWYWHSYQQSADFHFEFWHPEISWSRNNIPGLRDFQIPFIDRWSTGPDISKWTKLAEGRNNNQTQNHSVREKSREEREQPASLHSVWWAKLRFTLGSLVAFHWARLSSSFSPELCKELSALNPSGMLTGKRWEVSDMSQRNVIFPPGTKAAFIIISADMQCC